MTTTTFNTYAYFEKLKSGGVPETQAKAQAEAIFELVDEKLATKKDLEILAHKLTIRLGGMVAASFVATVATLAFLMDYMVKGIH